MAWEIRNQKSCFYRVVRDDGKVKRHYFGSGSEAEAEAARLEADKADKSAERERLAALQDELELLDLADGELTTGLTDLIDAALICEGFHKHRGQWRRLHGRKQPNRTDPTSGLAETGGDTTSGDPGTGPPGPA